MGRKLKEYCHDSDGGCPLYFTKPGTVPLEYRGFMDATAVCRTRQNAGWMLNDFPIPYWAEKAHIVATSVFKQVENEVGDDDEDAGESFGHVKSKGDSGAFALIHQVMFEQGAKPKEDEWTLTQQ